MRGNNPQRTAYVSQKPPKDVNAVHPNVYQIIRDSEHQSHYIIDVQAAYISDKIVPNTSKDLSETPNCDSLANHDVWDRDVYTRTIVRSQPGQTASGKTYGGHEDYRGTKSR